MSHMANSALGSASMHDMSAVCFCGFRKGLHRLMEGAVRVS